MNDEKKKKKRNVYILFTDEQTNKQIGSFIWMRSYRKSYWTRFGVEDFRVGESTDVVDGVAGLFARIKWYNIQKILKKMIFIFSFINTFFVIVYQIKGKEYSYEHSQIEN